MTQKHFIFYPGIWIGEGNISISGSTQHIHFYTKWIVGLEGSSGIYCEQQVEQQGVERYYNRYLFKNVTADSFSIQITNDNIQNGCGTGIYNSETIAWDFPPQNGEEQDIHFEGYEIYTLLPDNTYEITAVYTSGDAFQTTITGKIWKK